MKLFKQLLVAPAALGLMAPMAVNAAELNLNGVSNYSASNEEVQSISNFSDVYPTDWAYQALTKLAERHGCKAANPSGSMTRYEAAALLNNCIGNVAQINEEERRLINEFGPELAVIKARVDGLESRVGEFEAGQFSPTTKINTETNFYIGARSYDEDCATCDDDAVHMKYTTIVNALTSFNGEDALKFDLEVGNATIADEIIPDTYVATGDNTLRVRNLYYTRPLGDLLFAAGPMFEMDALISTTTSTYSNEGLFEGWFYGPNGYSRHPKDGAPGAALAWISDSGFNAGVSYIAFDGADSGKGIGTDEGLDLTTFSVGYDGDNFGGGFVYTLYENPEDILGYAQVGAANYGDPTIMGLGAYWNVSEKFDISFGLDWIDPDYLSYETLQSWSVGGDYDLGSGTLSAGMANVVDYSTSGDQEDAGTAYEVYYSFPVSDNITVKPMIMIHSLGSSGGVTWVDDTTYSVETTFKF